MTAPLVTVTGLATGYGGEVVLSGVTFHAEAGERVAVLGPNGGGKSTLLRALVGELPALAGSVEVRGRCGVVPQTDRSRLDFPVSAHDVALMGTLARLPWWRRPGRRERAGAQGALERVGLGELARTTFGALSGGQRQRVLVARALAAEADVLLLDEPFVGLDAAAAAGLEALVDELADEGRAVLVATHDLPQARRWDRILCLHRRQLAFGGPEVLTREVLEQTYPGAILALPGDDPGAPGPVIPAPLPHRHERRA